MAAGVKAGTVYGTTDDFGLKAVENPVHPHDLHATILHLLGFDHTRLTYRYSGRDFRLTDVGGEFVKPILTSGKRLHEMSTLDSNADSNTSTTDAEWSGGRREFGKVALGGALGAAALWSSQAKSSAAVHPNAPGIKICVQSPATPTDDDLLFLRQLGVGYVSVGSTPELRTAEGFLKIKKTYGDAGVTVWNIGNSSVHNMPEVTLNLPGRDQKIEEYKEYLRNLGKAGIYYTTYAHMGNGIWSSGRAEIRGASGREFDAASPNKQGIWQTAVFREPLSHGRVFTPEEIWENYTYFIKQVAPVAEEAGVRIGIHPDDPPVPVLAGVPRCIFGNFEGYKRALEIANSPNVGICLCCGTWLEGGKQLTGKDPEEMIRYFGAKKIWKIHFRNVSAPLPHFVETFMDNGYYDMYKIMKALRDVNYDGIVILDHSPTMVGGRYAQIAYGVAYMKALLNRANAEAKG